jgi:hypothetical protein
MARAGKFKSPAVSNTNELPAEQPFIASAVKIQSMVIWFAVLQPGNALRKFWRNRGRIEKRSRSGSRTRRKKERRIKVVRKTSALTSELMALKTPTQICEVQTTSAHQNCLPDIWGTGRGCQNLSMNKMNFFAFIY